MEKANNNKKDLDANKTDLLASIAKSTVGLVPYAGGFMAEIIGNTIPNQRIDRIAEFCKNLDAKFSEIPIERLNKYLNNEEFIDFLEESFIQASRAFTDERRNYILHIIINGITNDYLELIQSKHLLKILNELNDIEIIWLMYFYTYSTIEYREYYEKHSAILEKVYAHIQSDEDTLIKAAIQESYKEHLVRLELVYVRTKIEKETGQPKYNRASGKPETSNPHITNLGKLLLKEIGLISAIKAKKYSPDSR